MKATPSPRCRTATSISGRLRPEQARANAPLDLGKKRLFRWRKPCLFRAEMPVDGPRSPQERMKVLSGIYAHGRPKAPKTAGFLGGINIAEIVLQAIY